MRGLMMDKPLFIADLIEFAATYHGDAEIVTRTVEGPIHRYNYSRGEPALEEAGLGARTPRPRPGRSAGRPWPGTPTAISSFIMAFPASAPFAIRSIRGFLPSSWFISSNHAEDRVVFLDLTFVPLLEKLQAELPLVEYFVLLDRPRAHAGIPLRGLLCYEDLLAAETDEGFAWPSFDENTASSSVIPPAPPATRKACSTATALTVLHSYGVCLVDTLRPFARVSSCRSCRCSTPMPGAFPTRRPSSAASWFSRGRLDGQSVFELLDGEGDPDRRGADGLADAAQLPARDRPDLPIGEAGGDRRLGGAAVDDRGVPGAPRLRGGARLGHDRNQPARHGRRAQTQHAAFRSAEVDRQLKQGRAMARVEMRIVGEEANCPAARRGHFGEPAGARTLGGE